MDLFEFLKASGMLVIPLVVCSVISMTFILERFFYWGLFWIRKDEDARRRILTGTDTRLGRCRDRVAEVLKVYMDRPNDPAIAKIEAERLMRESRAYLKVLTWIANLSTSLGLLGTVVGVSMSLKHLDDPAKLTAGLSVALNTTIIGLVIYLITYTFLTWFTSRSTKLSQELKELLTEAKRSIEARRQRVGSPGRPAAFEGRDSGRHVNVTHARARSPARSRP